MRNFLSRVLILLFGVTSSPLALLAADTTTSVTATQTAGKIHHFSIITVPTAKVGEAIDVTVEARDKDDKVLTSYRGSIFFQSDTDFGASLPAQGKAIQFKESDNGVKTFSKWVTFKRVGKQELAVTEATEDVGGSITITIEDAANTQPVTANEPITIAVPERGSTVTTDTIMVSGKTKKNSNVSIKFNGKDSGVAKTDETGIYTYKLSGISQQENLITVSVLDGNNNVIGSTETQFGYAGRMPTYFNTSIKPGLEVQWGTGIVITVDAEPGLTSVFVLIDGTTLPAREDSPGKYTVSTVAPAKSWNYPIEVTLKNILAQTTNKPDAAMLTVLANSIPIITPPIIPPVVESTGSVETGEILVPQFKNVVTTMEGTKVNLNFSVDNIPPNTDKFKIVYGDTADTLSNEVLTFSLEKIRRPNGTYNWYIDNLPPKNYTFKIFWVAKDGTITASFVSDPITLTVGKQGACTIGNVSSVKATTLADKTVLSWDALPGAISYNVYRISASRDLELVENVKQNTYTIHLAPGTATYADFAVKALCDEKTESSTPAMASRVQTGPNLLAILVLVAALGSVLLLRRKMI